MTKLKQVEAYIRKVCPETMKLGFGCNIYKDDYWENTEDKRLYGVVVNRRGEGWDECVYALLDNSQRTYSALLHISDFSQKHSEGWKILGHELRLEHVLRSLAYAGKSIFIDIAGSFYEEIELHEIRPFSVSYDPNKPLHLQSEELIDFLFNIFYAND